MRDQLNRRDVIKTVLVTSAYSLINNKLWAAKAVGEVTAAAEPTDGIARIPLSAFPALANNGGAVRLTSSAISGDLTRGIFPPVHINRISATEYVAMESACTHEGAVLGNFSGTVANGSMSCLRHGSRFTIRGNMVNGSGPAPSNSKLLNYPVTLKGNVLEIRLPFMSFDYTQQMVLNGTEQRMELTWPSNAFVEYEVRHRPDLATEATRVNMATTLGGTVTATFRTGDANDGPQRCWVIPQPGFYQIAIRLRA